MKRLPVLWVLLATVIAAAWSLPTTAAADLRAGAAGDPRDQPDNLSGPRRPDVEEVRVQYDEAGRIDVTFRFFDPIKATSSQSRRLTATVSANVDNGRYAEPGGTCQPYNGNVVTIYADVATVNDGYQTASVSGYDGGLRGTRTVSADDRELTVSFASEALAGRGYRCVTQLSTFVPDYDGHCAPSYSNCRYISYRYTEDEIARFYFHGHAPPPRPVCSNGVDDDADGSTDHSSDPGCTDDGDPDEANPACSDGIDNEGDGQVDDRDSDCGYDKRGTSEGSPPVACENGRDDDGDGRTDMQDPGCRGKATGESETDPSPVKAAFTLKTRARRCTIETEAEVLPDLTPARLFPFAEVRISVQGPGYRRTRSLPLGEDDGYVFERLNPGVYRVRGSYLGDRWRLASRRVTRRVRISSRRCHQRRGTKRRG